MLVAPEENRAGFEKFCDGQVKQWELLYLHGISNKKNRRLLASVKILIIVAKGGLNVRFFDLKD